LERNELSLAIEDQQSREHVYPIAPGNLLGQRTRAINAKHPCLLADVALQPVDGGLAEQAGASAVAVHLDHDGPPRPQMGFQVRPTPQRPRRGAQQEKCYQGEHADSDPGHEPA
jgi:hypothetical protein